MPRSQSKRRDGQYTSHVGSAGPSPHGLAALLVVESLMHAIVEKGLISSDEAFDIIEAAAEVEADLLDIDRSLIGSDEGILAPLADTFRIGRRD